MRNLKHLRRQQRIFLVVVLVLGTILCSSFIVFALQEDVPVVKKTKNVTIEIQPARKKNAVKHSETTTEKSELATEETTKPTPTQPMTTQPKKIKKHIKKRKVEKKEAYPDYTWNGPELTPRKGVNQGPSGKETYYNLKMDGCISLMKEIKENPDSDKYIRGLSMSEKQKIINNINTLTSFEQSVGEKGVKKIGQYVMCAADLRIRPKGTILKTSFGWGMVVDTGTFAYTKDPTTQLDIAVAW